MTRLGLRGLAARPVRAVLTALAIVLGVAMMSGSLVLSDAVTRAFESIFTSSYRNTDAVVSGRKIVDWSNAGAATVDAALLSRIEALPEVETASGQLIDIANTSNQVKMLSREGDIIEGGGNPTLGFGVEPDEPQFNPMTLDAGSWADAPDEVVIDAATAKDFDFAVGDAIRIAGVDPAQRFTVSGVASFGDVDSLGGATVAIFDVPTAQEMLGKDGFDAISVAAASGVSQDEVADAIRPLLPETAQIRTGDAQADSDRESIQGFMDFLRWFLLGFAGVALFVGAFVIFNTLSITVAQRTRELATLRTLGASRRQVLTSVVVEAIALGLLASAVGIAAGFGLARGLTALFSALELDLPQADMRLGAGVVIASLAVGTLVTLAAGLAPAVRATRVSPILAVREGAVEERRRGGRARVAAPIVVALATAAVGAGLFAGGIPVVPRILLLVGGFLGLFVGVALLAPRLVAPLAGVVGWPAARLGGEAGRLARANAVRNPARTAITAAALMIGLALVTFVAVLGSGMRDSATSAVRDQVTADGVVTSRNGWNTLTRGAGEAVAGAPGVEAATSVRYERAQVRGSNADVHGVDAGAIGRFYRFDWTAGDGDPLASLGAEGAVVRKDFADDHDVAVGDVLPIVTPTGERFRARVAGVFRANRFDALLGEVLIPHESFDAEFSRPADLFTFVDLADGASLGAARAAADGFPDALVQTKDAWVDARVSDFATILNLLYVLLALSVVVSLFGMVNALVLAVLERRRELGMLRAIGLSRRQARRMVRHESVITALIGAALGMPLGIALAAAVTQALSEYDLGFSLPVGTLVAFAVVAVVAGVLAAVVPARRAARLDVLSALQYE